MARTFPKLPFGPMTVRPLLRARLKRKERVIGWTTALIPPTTSVALFQAALAVLPGVGPAAGAVLMPGDRGLRLVVVTDRRVLVVAPGAPPEPARVAMESGLGGLRITRPSAGRFHLRMEDGSVCVLQVPASGPRRFGWAVEALCLMAEPEGAETTTESAARRIGRAAVTAAAAGKAASLARSSYGELLGPGPFGRQ